MLIRAVRLAPAAVHGGGSCAGDGAERDFAPEPGLIKHKNPACPPQGLIDQVIAAKFDQRFSAFFRVLLLKCRRWDLNPHERNAHYALNVARLPIPPLRPAHAILPRIEVLSTSFGRSAQFQPPSACRRAIITAKE